MKSFKTGHMLQAFESIYEELEDKGHKPTLHVLDNCPIQLWCKFIPQFEITLDILRTSRVDPTKSACRALNGKKFDWNRTPSAPLGSRALSFFPSTVRNTFQSHAIYVWYVGPSMIPYREMHFNNPKTGYYTSSGTYKLFPAHARMSSISEDDHTIMAAMDLLEMFKEIVPASAIEKRNHCKILRSLTHILSRHQTPRRNRWTTPGTGEQ